MVDVNAYSNRKLIDRGGRIISRITGVDREKGLELLHAANGRVKTGIVMQLCGVSREEAEELLARHGGNVRAVIQNGR